MQRYKAVVQAHGVKFQLWAQVSVCKPFSARQDCCRKCQVFFPKGRQFKGANVCKQIHTLAVCTSSLFDTDPVWDPGKGVWNMASFHMKIRQAAIFFLLSDFVWFFGKSVRRPASVLTHYNIDVVIHKDSQTLLKKVNQLFVWRLGPNVQLFY